MKSKKGFSLLELVLAIAVFSLASVGLATMLIDSSINTKLAIEKTEALFYAKEGIEAVRTIRDNSWSDLVDGNHGLTGSGLWTFSGSSDVIDTKYTRVINITTQPATSTKLITSLVSWELTPSRTASTTIKTILADWKM